MALYRLAQKNYIPPVKEYGIIRAVKKDLAQGYTPHIAIVGRPRVGKSTCSISLSQRFDKKYDIEKHCFFDAEQFFETFDKSRGRFLSVEEADEIMNRLNTYGDENQFANSIFRTQSILGNTMILVFPALSSLSTIQIPFIKYVIEVTKKDEDKRINIANTYALEYKYRSFKRVDVNWWTLDRGMKIPAPKKEVMDKFRELEKKGKKNIYDKHKNKYWTKKEMEDPSISKINIPKIMGAANNR